MICPNCNKEMELIDNTTFMSESVINQLFGFKPTHYGCFECNKVLLIKHKEGV